jgi:hypothetical protein
MLGKRHKTRTAFLLGEPVGFPFGGVRA